MRPTFTAAGDAALLVTLGDSIDLATHARVRAARRRIDLLQLPQVIETVPSYASVLVHFDPRTIPVSAGLPYEWLADRIAPALSAGADGTDLPSRVVDIPVCYGGGHGPDLQHVAQVTGMSAGEVARRHAAAEYLVYLIGFVPGFAYLGGLPRELATPRRLSPRTHVPAGSVGIGGEQTGVYPMESPGGWNLIGTTPLAMFAEDRDPPALLAAGDRVRFRPISEAEFDALRRR